MLKRLKTLIALHAILLKNKTEKQADKRQVRQRGVRVSEVPGRKESRQANYSEVSLELL